MVTVYKTLNAPGVGEYKEKGSRFIGYAFNVETADDVKTHVGELKREHAKARHRCFAYRLGTAGVLFRTFDDGEPSGTAGKPILGQIDSFGVTNALVVVVRYFGGVLLGASGLNHAYKTAARLALEAAVVVERDVTFGFTLRFPADALPDVMALLKKHKIQTTTPRYDNGYEMEAFLPAALGDALVTALRDRGVKTEAI